MNNKWMFHNSHETFYRKPFGAVECGTKIRFRIKVDENLNIKNIFLRLWVNEKEEKMLMKLNNKWTGLNIYEAMYTVPINPDLIWYYFIIETDYKNYFYGNNDSILGGEGQVKECEPCAYQITVYKKDLQTPNWLKQGIIYQIFVDRFYNGNPNQEVYNLKPNCYLHPKWDDIPFYLMHPYKNEIASYDFFGGNLLGIIKKLPYLKDLGISIIYLNPIFEAESNHKYDTGDYHKIDPMFGTNEFLEELCSKASKYGIKIILDGVFSHTGSNSKYFNKKDKYNSLGAFQSKDSPYYSWYRFIEYPNDYESWWGIDTLPNVNEMDSSYQKFICSEKKSVLKYWLNKGIKGWRLDVADEIPDEFIKMIKQTIKEKDNESVLIGEVWEDASNKVSYGKLREYLLGDEFDSIMNYPFRNIFLDFLLNRCDAEHSKIRLMNIYENYPLEIFYSNMNLIGTHDIERILTILGEAPPEHSLSKKDASFYKLSGYQKELAIKRLKLLTLFQMTFPGVPSIYYGDEVGNEGFTDPLNRNTYPWGKENEEILNWYKKIINIRNKYPCLRTGKWINIYSVGDVYIYLRIIKNGVDIFGNKYENNTIFTLVNRSYSCKHCLKVNVTKWCQTNLLMNILNKEKYEVNNGYLEMTLEPLEGKLLLVED